MNLFDAIPQAMPTEQMIDLIRSDGLRIERIVSYGQATPAGQWYDQAWDEWVIVLQGEAVLQLADEAQARRLQVGDSVWLPAHCRHRVEFTQASPPTIWLAVHREST